MIGTVKYGTPKASVEPAKITKADVRNAVEIVLDTLKENCILSS